ncbi:MAG: 4Fe-4S dicluster domain-containing protein [Melioribacter sp.]|uniref:4Fe-4S dicluster domain-containing protein n=1 Tax=Rosettibacter primus TaxID=3111523 RepID=UPI00247B72AD|nr:4Fe-4S dicluster domain-containing protein [Melioribacter sp.]
MDDHLLNFNSNMSKNNNERMKEKLVSGSDEFPESVKEDFDLFKLSKVSRRKFLALLSASTAFATAACSDYRDKGEIVPYNKRPEEILPGIPNYYASTCSYCSNACGILIKTREGRPIKIDGNPDHPINKGKICAKGQASILNLYDPERLREPLKKNKKLNWESIDKEIIGVLKNSIRNNKKVAIITNTIISPTAKKVLEEFKKKYINTIIISYDLFNDNQRRNAWLKSYGTHEYPSIKWNEAEVVLSIDSDFLGNEGNFIENTIKFTSKRDVIKSLNYNRLYAAESRMTITGMMADYRLRISPHRQFEFVMSLINELIKYGSAINLDKTAIKKFQNYSINNFNIHQEKLNNLINDLNNNRGKSIVYAGETLPEDVHIAVNLLNEILGNNKLYDYSISFKKQYENSTQEEILQLIDLMNSGEVDVVIHFDSNPVFHFPKDFGYDESIKKVKTVISLTESHNETSSLSNYILPINNQLESWGDANARNGIYSLMQPVISPIFNTRQKEAVLLNWIYENEIYDDKIYHNYLMKNFEAEIYSKLKTSVDFKTFWYSALHDGVVLISEENKIPQFKTESINYIKNEVIKSDYVVHLTQNYFIGDGKFSNNGWLQELPHPVTKVTWDNYAAISKKTASKLNLEMNDLVEIEVENRKLVLPVFIQPGMNDDTIHIELGYGRKVVGEVGKDVGFNAVNLMSKNFTGSPFIYTNAKIKKSNGKHILAATQEHHSLDDKFVKDFHRIRKIIQEGTIVKYQKEPHFLHKEKHDLFSITREHKFSGVKWAMAIDLNKCTACNACVASCNVENNIPVVGKDQVERSREMQWIRIDRYYSGTEEEPIVSNQPMLCQHCDNAPCENVCPVSATNHSPDGLNQMVYNRCVGTRYCSNNCPYKVRRFNFYNFRDHFQNAYYENELTSLVNNPEVTVRSRGVMEKCTFCIQRIMEARSNAIKEGREIKGNDVVTACQQACPSNAIIFGDMNDPDSEISKLRNHNLSYYVLEELNIKPNVTYIAKLRNIHSEEIE